MIYYTEKPQATTTPPELAYAFDNSKTSTRCTTQGTRRGPNEQPGTYLYAGTLGDQNPLDATWRKIPKTDGLWVGFHEDERPKPADLLRPDALKGHEVELTDGQKWLVPVARMWTMQDGDVRWLHTVPRQMDMDDDGEWIPGKPIMKYARLVDVAQMAWDAIVQAIDESDEETNEIDVTVGDHLDWCCEVLSVNYRLHYGDVIALGLFDEDSYGQILSALCDLDSAMELTSKKNAPPDDSSLNAGNVEPTLATVPQ